MSRRTHLGGVPLRICYLANGQSVHTQNWVRYFAEREYDIHLITFEKTRRMKGVKIQELRYFSKLAYPFRILEVKRAVKNVDPDVLHAHYVSHYGMYGALADFRPFVVSAWGSDILVDPKRSMLKRYVVRYVLKKADLITADSKSLMKAAVNFGAVRERVKLVICGVDLKRFIQELKVGELKEKLSIPASSSVVVSTRSLEPIYDVETLIKAMSVVLRSNPDVYLIIVGTGSLRRKLEVMTERLKVSKNVRFVGMVPYVEVPKFLGVSDVYVSTPLSDSSSISLLEAMACELPPVVTDLEGNREWIKDGMNGFVFPKRDFRALAEKILYLLKNEDVRRKFGVINRRIVEKEGDYEKEMSRMEKLYKDLVEAYNV